MRDVQLREITCSDSGMQKHSQECHSRLFLRCLSRHCKERLESALATVNGRIRVASDIMYLRSIGKLRTRLSMHHETDRLTKLL